MEINVNGVSISVESDTPTLYDEFDSYSIATESAAMLEVLNNAYDHLGVGTEGLVYGTTKGIGAAIHGAGKGVELAVELVNKLVYAAEKIWDKIITFLKSIIQFITTFVQSTTIKLRAKKLIDTLKTVNQKDINFGASVKVNVELFDVKSRRERIISLQSTLDKANKKIRNIANSHFKTIARTAAKVTVAVEAVKFGANAIGISGMIQIAEIGIVAVGVASYVSDKKKYDGFGKVAKVSKIFKELDIPMNPNGMIQWLNECSSGAHFKELSLQRKRAIESQKNATELSKITYVEKVGGAMTHRAIDFDRKVMSANQLGVRLQNEIVKMELSRIQTGLRAIEVALAGNGESK